jgi:hypothetical protein
MDSCPAKIWMRWLEQQAPKLSKYDVEVITFTKIRPIPLLKMGKKACQWIKGTSKHSNEHGFKNFSKYTN